MAVAIRPLGRAAAAAWDEFIEAHPDGTFFHRAAWCGIIERAFGHATFYVFAERDGAITGVLPLAQVKTVLFGNTLISVPFCVYGGPLAVDQESAAALSSHAASLLERTGAAAVEFRYRGAGGTQPTAGSGVSMATSATADALTPLPLRSRPAAEPIDCGSPPAGPGRAVTASDGLAAGTVQSVTPPIVISGADSEPLNDFRNDGSWLSRPDLYVTFRKQIEADHDKNLKSVPRKQRAMVRKGIQNGLHSVVDRDVSRLHGIYAESVRNLGTPVFARRYFALLAEVFAGDCDILTVLDDDNPIASVMNFYFRAEVLPYYGGGTALARQRAANDFMYWEVMRRAADRGCRLFDFGRSKIGTGAYDFKRNWGFMPEPLHYRYKLAPGAAIPDHNPLNPKYRLFIAGWKRLPLAVANAIGPSIVRGLG
jgi:hypothetical protein